MKEQELFDITYLPLRISLIALSRAELPAYLGSTLRGVVGTTLYHIDRGAYQYLYENGKREQGKQDIVKPYILIPPAACGTKKIVEKGELLEFELVLLGDAVKYASALIEALKKIEMFGMGAYRYKFCLSQVIHSREQRILWREGVSYLSEINPVKLPCYGLANVTGAVVKLCTPLRIRRGGQLLEHISFHTLIRNITNRMVRITERYGGRIDTDEIERIQSLAEEIEITREKLWVNHLERYSNRRKEKMDFSGLLGEIEYRGDMTPFVPWLFAAQTLHIGRNTTFGMGKIQIYFI